MPAPSAARVISLASVGLVIGLAQPSLAAITASTIALSGVQPSLGPNVGAGVDFASFGNPVINASGLVAFRGTLGGSVLPSRDTGLWIWSGSSNTNVVREGDAVSGVSGAIYGDLGSFSLGSGGHIGFTNAISGTGITTANNDVLVSGLPGSLAPIGREASPAGGTSGPVFGSSFNPNFGLSASGQIGFNNTLLTGTGGVTAANDVGFWRTNAGSQDLIVREGDAAPGIAGPIISTLQPPSRFDDSGASTFWARLSGGGVASTNDAALWFAPANGSPTLLAREGDSAPGTDAVFSQFVSATTGTVVPSAGGRVVFQGNLTGGTSTSSNNAGIWTGLPGSLQVLARTGDAAPGAPNATFISITSAGSVAINAAGTVAFRSSLTGSGATTTTNTGIWLGTPGSLELVAREGDALPGLVDVLLADVSNAAFTIDALSRVAFLANLSGAGVTGSSDVALIAFVPGVGQQVVIREGDSILCADGVTRVVSGLGFQGGLGGQSGASSALAAVAGSSALSRLVYRATFTDGFQGVFSADIIPAPAPASIALLTLGFAAARRRRN